MSRGVVDTVTSSQHGAQKGALTLDTGSRQRAPLANTPGFPRGLTGFAFSSHSIYVFCRGRGRPGRRESTALCGRFAKPPRASSAAYYSSAACAGLAALGVGWSRRAPGPVSRASCEENAQTCQAPLHTRCDSSVCVPFWESKFKYCGGEVALRDPASHANDSPPHLPPFPLPPRHPRGRRRTTTRRPRRRRPRRSTRTTWRRRRRCGSLRTSCS